MEELRRPENPADPLSRPHRGTPEGTTPGWRNPGKLRSPRRMLFLLVLFSLSWLHQSIYDFENDDAYISYRYARNWSEGHGPVFNPGERVEGYSNFLLVACLAAVHGLGGDIVFWSRALGTVSLWGTILLVFLVLWRELGRGTAAALAGGLVVTLHASLAAWARSGMETLPLACVVLLAQATFLRQQRRGQAYWLAGLLYTGAALLRSDGFVHAGAAALFCVVSRRDRRRLWTLLLPFLAVCVPIFLWRWHYYGYFLPNPYYLRTGGDVYQQLRGLFYVHNYVTAFGGLLAFALPLLLVFLRDPSRDAARLFLGTSIALFGLYVVWVGGDYMPMGRLFVPITGALVILQIEAILELTAHLPAARPRQAAFALLAVALAVAPCMATLNRRRPPQNRAIQARVQVQQWTLAGRWLRDHVPEGTLVAAEPVGALGYYSGLPIVDMLGVNDVHIAHRESASMGHSTAGHQKRDFDYVLSRRPQLLFRGVWPDCAGNGKRLAYPDGSVYRVRCIPLGHGPVASSFGEVWETELYLRLEEKAAVADAPVEPG